MARRSSSVRFLDETTARSEEAMPPKPTAPHANHDAWDNQAESLANQRQSSGPAPLTESLHWSAVAHKEELDAWNQHAEDMLVHNKRKKEARSASPNGHASSDTLLQPLRTPWLDPRVVTSVSVLLAHALILAVLSSILGVFVDVTYREGSGITTPILLVQGILISLPLLLFRDFVARYFISRKLTKAVEFVIHVTFGVIVLVATSRSFSSENRFAMRQRLTEKLQDEFMLDGRFPGRLSMVDSFENLYEWMRGPVVEHFLCPDPLGAGTTSANSSAFEMCYLQDGVFASVGAVQVRQLRVLPEDDPNNNLHFFSSDRQVSAGGAPLRYGGKLDSPEAFDDRPTWELSSRLTLEAEPALYRNHAGIEVPAFGTFGWYDRYSFGGFVAELNGSMASGQATVDELSRSGFLDRYSRALVVETVLVNPSLGLWALVYLLIELPEEGSLRISSANAVQVMRNMGRTFSIFSLALIEASYFAYGAINEFRRLLRNGSRVYFQSPNTYFSLFLILLTLYIVVDLVRTDYYFPDLAGPDAATQLMRGAYTVTYIQQRSSDTLGLQLFIFCLIVLKFIPQLSRRFSVILDTLQNAVSDLVAITIIAAIIAGSFALYFHMTLGGYLLEFSTFSRSTYYVTLGLSAVWNPESWFESSPGVAMALLLLFTLLVTWLIATMIIAIFTEAFVSAKEELRMRLTARRLSIESRQRELMRWCNDGTSDALPASATSGVTRAVAWFIRGVSNVSVAVSRRRGLETLSVKSARAAEGSVVTVNADDVEASPTDESAFQPIRESTLQMTRPHPAYFLKLVVWGASHVCQKGQVADPCIKLHILTGNLVSGEMKSSRTLRSNREPEWNEPFVLYPPSLGSECRIVISVVDADRVTGDDLMGYVIVPVSQFANDADEVNQMRHVEFTLRPSISRTRRLGRTQLFDKQAEDEIRLRATICLHTFAQSAFSTGSGIRLFRSAGLAVLKAQQLARGIGSTKRPHSDSASAIGSPVASVAEGVVSPFAESPDPEEEDAAASPLESPAARQSRHASTASQIAEAESRMRTETF